MYGRLREEEEKKSHKEKLNISRSWVGREKRRNASSSMLNASHDAIPLTKQQHFPFHLNLITVNAASKETHHITGVSLSLCCRHVCWCHANVYRKYLNYLRISHLNKILINLVELNFYDHAMESIKE